MSDEKRVPLYLGDGETRKQIGEVVIREVEGETIVNLVTITQEFREYLL